jgi:hypothetical protein
LVDKVRVDGVHQPGADLSDRGSEDTEDGDGDDYTDDRVGLPPAGRGCGNRQPALAGEPDKRSGDNRPQVGDVTRVDQPVDPRP